MKPTVIDLFAGVGGLSLGFEQAGFHVVLANEYDDEIAAAYRKNHPETKMVVGDITALDLENTFGVFSGKLCKHIFLINRFSSLLLGIKGRYNLLFLCSLFIRQNVG